MTDPTTQPAAPAGAQKAWWGAAVAALMTAAMATYTAANADFVTLWDAAWCAVFSSLQCPEIGAVPAALKSIGATLLDQWWKALAAGGAVQQVVYWISNKAK